MRGTIIYILLTSSEGICWELSFSVGSAQERVCGRKVLLPMSANSHVIFDAFMTFSFSHEEGGHAKGLKIMRRENG